MFALSSMQLQRSHSRGVTEETEAELNVDKLRGFCRCSPPSFIPIQWHGRSSHGGEKGGGPRWRSQHDLLLLLLLLLPPHLSSVLFLPPVLSKIWTCHRTEAWNGLWKRRVSAESWTLAAANSRTFRAQFIRTILVTHWRQVRYRHAFSHLWYKLWF